MPISSNASATKWISIRFGIGKLILVLSIQYSLMPLYMTLKFGCMLVVDLKIISEKFFDMI